MPTNHDQYKTGEHDSNSPMNREQLPRELTEVEQLQDEVDELSTKLREATEANKYQLGKRIAASKLVNQLETLERKSGFRITGATLNDGKEYLRIKEELFNLIMG